MERNEIFDTWPYNLALHVLKDEKLAGNISVVGFFKALETLAPKEQHVLALRIRDKRTLDEVGTQYDRTRERVRQIQAKAERKLRHPSRQRMYLCVPENEYQIKCKELEQLRKDYDILTDKLEQYEKNRQPETLTAAEYLLEREKPIEDLNLTVRSYNALKRAGKNTVGDVMNCSFTDLRGIRNLGKASIENICAALAERGLYIKPAA